MSYAKELKKPTSLPQSEEERTRWQKSNYEWWQNNPMRYDRKDKISYNEFSEGFFREIDSRHFANAKEYLPIKNVPFDALIDFETLKDKDVLEIGVGNGSHAGLLTQSAKSFTGIDLTDYAVKSASERFRIFDLRGKILKMDAEALSFPDRSFDFVWSWGVIHHSANTPKILEEIHRVLRPGGEAIIMVYHRGWWDYYVTGLVLGLYSGDFFRGRSIHKVIQRSTDGAIARYYTPSEWRKMTEKLFEVRDVFTLGPKSDVVLLPGGKMKNFLQSLMPNDFNRFLTKNLQMGSFLVSKLRKEA